MIPIQTPTGPAAGVGSYERKTGNFSAVSAGITTVTVSCTAGKKIVGGGFKTLGYQAGNNVLLISANSATADDTWTVSADDAFGYGVGASIAAFAICI